MTATAEPSGAPTRGGAATEAQRQMLIARDGGCFACGTDPDMCDIHHVEPVSQGGPTSLDNLVLACWQHHNAVHHFGWRIHGPPGNRTLHPPDTVNYGPARAPDRPVLFSAPNGHADGDAPPPTNADPRIAVAARTASTHGSPGPATARAALRTGRDHRTRTADQAKGRTGHPDGGLARKPEAQPAPPVPLFAPD